MTRASTELALNVRALVPLGKGILAIDGSVSAVSEQFRAVGLEPTQENRRAYREMLLTTPGMETYLSGAVLSGEAIREETAKGVPFAELLTGRGIMPGVRADLGLQPLDGLLGERVAGGVEHLDKRLPEYRQLGAWFAQWRAHCAIGHGIPTETCLRTNAVRLAYFAARAQEAGLVPIADIEVLTEGDHTSDRSREVTAHALELLVAELCVHHAEIEELLIGIGIVLPGRDCPVRPSIDEVTTATLRCLREHVPAAVPGVVISAEGLPEDAATVCLDKIDHRREQPWHVSFMLGPGLQATALRTWAQDPEDVRAAQGAFRQRSAMTAAARDGWLTSHVVHPDDVGDAGHESDRSKRYGKDDEP